MTKKVKTYVLQNGNVYEYEIPCSGRFSSDPIAKYTGLTERQEYVVWGNLSLGRSLQEAFIVAGVNNVERVVL